MKDRLEGKTVAVLATHGVEQVELTEPRRILEKEGAVTEIIALDAGPIQAYDHADKSDLLPVDKPVADAHPEDYDGLVLPGGVRNPDHLRQDAAAVDFVRELFVAGKPVGVICHGPWTLVEAGVLKGRTLTSYPSLKTDITNAGGSWVDREVVNDDGLISSRGPQDLPAFCAELVEELASGPRPRRAVAW